MSATQEWEGYEGSPLEVCISKYCSPHVEDGDILLFPPYLDHSVESKPHHKDRMRMTFSFNITLNL